MDFLKKAEVNKQLIDRLMWIWKLLTNGKDWLKINNLWK